MMGRAGNSDESTWRVGGNIAYAGFDIGGEIGETDDNTEKVLTATTETSADKDLWSVGVRYKTGPWTIAANYIESESEGLTSDVDEDEFQQYGVQATYNLSKGIDLGFTLNHVEFDDESRNNGAAGDAANSNEGWYVSTGLRLTF
jgi:predicted porin